MIKTVFNLTKIRIFRQVFGFWFLVFCLTTSNYPQTCLGAELSFINSSGAKAYIWGEVKSPGAYLLSGATSVIELISLAGGPTPKADLSNVYLIRTITPLRQRINLKKSLNSGEVILLQAGDIVLIPQSFSSKLKDNLPLITTLAVFTNLIITIIQTQKK
ncbi:MAG: SLBB domain-containing protein [candidate division WOR-3 bacterium]